VHGAHGKLNIFRRSCRKLALAFIKTATYIHTSAPGAHTTSPTPLRHSTDARLDYSWYGRAPGRFASFSFSASIFFLIVSQLISTPSLYWGNARGDRVRSEGR